MKVTLDSSAPLLRQAEAVAAERSCSLGALVAEALREKLGVSAKADTRPKAPRGFEWKQFEARLERCPTAA